MTAKNQREMGELLTRIVSALNRHEGFVSSWEPVRNGGDTHSDLTVNGCTVSFGTNSDGRQKRDVKENFRLLQQRLEQPMPPEIADVIRSHFEIPQRKKKAKPLNGHNGHKNDHVNGDTNGSGTAALAHNGGEPIIISDGKPAGVMHLSGEARDLRVRERKSKRPRRFSQRPRDLRARERRKIISRALAAGRQPNGDGISGFLKTLAKKEESAKSINKPIRAEITAVLDKLGLTCKSLADLMNKDPRIETARINARHDGDERRRNFKFDEQIIENAFRRADMAFDEEGLSQLQLRLNGNAMFPSIIHHRILWFINDQLASAGEKSLDPETFYGARQIFSESQATARSQYAYKHILAQMDKTAPDIGNYEEFLHACRLSPVHFEGLLKAIHTAYRRDDREATEPRPGRALDQVSKMLQCRPSDIVPVDKWREELNKVIKAEKERKKLGRNLEKDNERRSERRRQAKENVAFRAAALEIVKAYKTLDLIQTTYLRRVHGIGSKKDAIETIRNELDHDKPEAVNYLMTAENTLLGALKNIKTELTMHHIAAALDVYVRDPMRCALSKHLEKINDETIGRKLRPIQKPATIEAARERIVARMIGAMKGASGPKL